MLLEFGGFEDWDLGWAAFLRLERWEFLRRSRELVF